MQNISNSVELKQAIAALEVEQSINGEILRKQFKITTNENANKNLEYINNDASTQTLKHADEIISNFDKMENASEELFRLLDAILTESKT